MTDEDDALLRRDLHWQSRPGDRRRPAGSNAITAIGIVLTLVQWAMTAVAISALPPAPPTSGMIEPRSLIVLVVFGAEMFVAGILAGRIWVAIGPGARAALRPIAVLGPWPMLLIAGFGALYVASFVAAPFLREAPPPTSGRNWRLIAGGDVTYEEALQLCDQFGDRVPDRDDMKAFDPPFPRGTPVWLSRREDEALVRYLSAEGRVTQGDSRSTAVRRFRVACFRP